MAYAPTDIPVSGVGFLKQGGGGAEAGEGGADKAVMFARRIRE